MNVSKTDYILVSSSRLSGSINVNNIKIKSQIKYLGVYIDQHLHWGPQIKHINNKLAKNRGIITKLRYHVNLHTVKQLYYSFIYPYLTYAIINWGSAWKIRLNRIRTKENKCIRSFFLHTVERKSLLEIRFRKNLAKLLGSAVRINSKKPNGTKTIKERKTKEIATPGFEPGCTPNSSSEKMQPLSTGLCDQCAIYWSKLIVLKYFFFCHSHCLNLMELYLSWIQRYIWGNIAQTSISKPFPIISVFIHSRALYRPLD